MSERINLWTPRWDDEKVAGGKVESQDEKQSHLRFEPPDSSDDEHGEPVPVLFGDSDSEDEDGVPPPISEPRSPTLIIQRISSPITQPIEDGTELEYQRHSFLSFERSIGMYSLSYLSWTILPHSRVDECRHQLLCAHGLTRNGLAFEWFANSWYRQIDSMSDDSRTSSKLIEMIENSEVHAWDALGRGQSMIKTAKETPSVYNFDTYQSDAINWINCVNHGRQSEITWIGSSMGGLLGIYLASRMSDWMMIINNDRCYLDDSCLIPKISRLVLNDIGPLVKLEHSHQIAEYVKLKNPLFDTLEELMMELKKRYSKDIGALMSSDKQWMRLAKNMSHQIRQSNDDSSKKRRRLLSSMKWTFAYDHDGIAHNLEHMTQDLNLFDLFEKIQIPILLIKGQNSPLVTDDLVRKMSQHYSGSLDHFKVVELANIGHGAMLQSEQECRIIAQFIQDTPV